MCGSAAECALHGARTKRLATCEQIQFNAGHVDAYVIEILQRNNYDRK